MKYCIRAQGCQSAPSQLAPSHPTYQLLFFPVMAPRCPSIQFFFKPEMMDSLQPITGLAPSGESFTSAEVTVTHRPKSELWQPRGHYENVQIGQLVPGSEPLRLLGRVINVYDQPTLSKLPHTAKGCVKVLIRDDTGIMVVCILQTPLAQPIFDRSAGPAVVCQGRLPAPIRPIDLTLDDSHFHCGICRRRIFNAA